MKGFLLKGGVLLGASAIISKFLGLWRDRLLLDVFENSETVDLVFASFRIPDFFFYLLIGGTVSTLFLPRITHLNKEKQTQFMSSFLWGVIIIFGIFCGLGVFFTAPLINLFAGGFDINLQTAMIPLARCLFGSVFLLSVSSVFSAFQQSHERFISIALAPILYTGTICGILFFFRDQFGLLTVGLGAIIGAGLHLSTNALYFFASKNKLIWAWKKPIESWKKFKTDFFHRILNNSAFQINQSADILIATFLIAGSVTAFSIGTNLGSALLFVVGMPVASSAFPKLAKAKHDHNEQKRILFNSLKWILLFSVPVAIVGTIFPELILRVLFNLEGDVLRMTSMVFFWTVLTVPLVCAIPIMARVFLANNDVKTPMKVAMISLFIATTVAAILSLVILPPETAILGLAIGTLVANVLSAGMYGVILKRKYFT